MKIDRAILSYLVSYYYTVRSDDVKVLNRAAKTKTTTPGNNIYTLLITFIAFTSFISSKFQTLFFPYKLSYYAWATCGKSSSFLVLYIFSAAVDSEARKSDSLHLVGLL